MLNEIRITHLAVRHSDCLEFSIGRSTIRVAISYCVDIDVFRSRIC